MDGTIFQQQSRGLFQPAARAVSYHGVAYFLGYRETKTNRPVIRPNKHLQHHAADRRLFARCRHTKKFRALAQADRLGIGLFRSKVFGSDRG